MPCHILHDGPFLVHWRLALNQNSCSSQLLLPHARAEVLSRWAPEGDIRHALPVGQGHRRHRLGTTRRLEWQSHSYDCSPHWAARACTSNRPRIHISTSALRPGKRARGRPPMMMLAALLAKHIRSATPTVSQGHVHHLGRESPPHPDGLRQGGKNGASPSEKALGCGSVRLDPVSSEPPLSSWDSSPLH